MAEPVVRKPWTEVVAIKQAERTAQNEKHSCHGKPDDEITSISDVNILVECLKNRRFAAEDVIFAYIDR